jgi:hypothetical protein
MQFELKIPFSRSHRPAALQRAYSFVWDGVKVEPANGWWQITASLDPEGFEQLLSGFQTIETEPKLWINPRSDVSIRLLDERPATLASLFTEDDESELEVQFEIPLDIPCLRELHLSGYGGRFDVDETLDVLHLTVPSTVTATQAMAFSAIPGNAEYDIIWIEDTPVGRIWKQYDDESPFQTLDGMTHTSAHPYLFHPVWPALPMNNVDIPAAITDIFEVAGWEDLEAEFRPDYLGISETDIPLLLAGVAHALEELCEEEYQDELAELWDDESSVEADTNEHPSEIDNIQHILASSLFAGTRLSRINFAKGGVDTSLQHALGERPTITLIEAGIGAREAFRRVSRDDRFAGVRSCELVVNRIVEGLLEQAILSVEWERIDPMAVWSWSCWAFDLGVRYQMARLGHDALLEWANLRHLEDDLFDFVDEDEHEE